MTDNEIIKALELCGKRPTGCLGCPYFGIGGHEERNADVLKLINRQKAEIERLQKYHDDMENAIFMFREDHAKVKFFKNEIRAEAIKAFAEKLKEVDGYNNHTFDDCASILVPEEYRKGRDEKIKEIWTMIDNLVKEMAGENT